MSNCSNRLTGSLLTKGITYLVWLSPIGCKKVMDFFVVVPVVTTSSQNLLRAVEFNVRNEGWAENENSGPLSLYKHLKLDFLCTNV